MNEGISALVGLLMLGVIVHAVVAYYKKDATKPAGPYKTRWNPLESVTVTVAAYLVSQLLAGFVLLAILGFDESRFDSQSVTINFLTTALFEIFTVTLLTLFLRRRKSSWRSIGLIRPTWKDPLYALSGYAVYFVSFLFLFVIAQKLFPQIDFNQAQELGFDTSTTGWALVLIFVSLVILPPIVEELVCRGFLFSGLRSKFNKIQAALITSLIFGAAHLQFGSGNSLLWVAALDTFVLSMVLVYLRDKTGGLSAPIMVHAIKNCIAFAALFIFHVA